MLGRAVTELGYKRAWTALDGPLDPDQHGLLAPYLRRRSLHDGQRTLLVLGTRATEGALQLWTT